MFYLIDKPVGISSFDVIRRLRKQTGIKKMGHTGTLDPLASGCLLIATENSTKLIPLIDTEEKSYIFTVDIGITSESLDLGTDTRTSDMSSMVIPTFHTIESTVLGTTKQRPPQYSALHIDGERAYDLARKGVEVTMPERDIQVTACEVISIIDTHITLSIRISAGGYIRSFAPSIAALCGVGDGGCVTSLRRTAIGSLSIERAQSLDMFDPERTLSYTELFPLIPSISTSDPKIDTALFQGKTLSHESLGISPIDSEYILLSTSHRTSLLRYQEGIWMIVKNNV